ncbi:MAG: hypothetical protein BWY82_01602 [Verrucomicrobia bacterium ADurb.Bin474]|nr:MAG: hypothetical protein BWY82_01602 [Verrucomicrobia bacterium ADurb.Bin474]
MAIEQIGIIDIHKKSAAAQRPIEKWRGLIFRQNMAICLTQLNYFYILFQPVSFHSIEFNGTLTQIKAPLLFPSFEPA